jgi:hypothetical protein
MTTHDAKTPIRFALRWTRTAVAAALACGALRAAAEPRPGLQVSYLDGDYGANHAIMIGSDGLPVIAYLDYGLTVAHCEDLACTSATVTQVDPNAGWFQSDAHVGLTIDRLGFPQVAYADYNGELRVAECADIACTSSYISPPLANRTGNDGFSDFSMVTGIDGNSLIAFVDYDADQLKVFHCADLSCTTGNLYLLDPVTAASRASVTIGGDGLGVVSYGGYLSPLKVAHCSNGDCSLSTRATVDQSPGGNGMYNSITIGNDGRPLIAYQHTNASEETLRVAYCNDATCSSSVVTTVDPGSHRGWYSTISIGGDGLGVVAYQSQADQTARIVHCANPACTMAGRVIAVPSSFGPSGDQVAMTIGTDGLPILAYESNSQLFAAHLSDRFGLPFVRRR